MRHLSGLLLLAGFCVVSASSADEKTVSPSIDRMKKDLAYLAGPECEGRGVETEGIQKAADHIAAHFKAFGLKTVTKDQSYFQPFTIKGSAKITGSPKLVVKGPKEFTGDLKAGKEFNVSGLTGSGTVSGGVAFVGHGITTKDKKWDDYKGIDVAGKIVVVVRRTPRFELKENPFPDSEVYAPFSVKIQAAVAAKAAGVLLVNDKKTAEKSDDLIPFEMLRGDEGANFPVYHIKRALVDQMLAEKKQTLAELETAMDKDMKPNSFVVEGWTVEGDVKATRPTLKTKNVVGLLEGSGPLAKEYVVIGAHYDHLGRGESGSLAKGNKEIHFGADDNGSGTTGMIELASRFSAMKERQGRSILFMAYSGEERGLLGSAYFCNREPLVPLKDIAIMLNLDMIGRGTVDEKATDKSVGEKLEVGGTGSGKGLNETIDEVNKKYKFAIKKSASGYGPSDHASFYGAKIPVYFFFTGLHTDYHRPGDTPDKINYTGMFKIVNMVEEIAVKMLTAERPAYLETKRDSSIGAPRGPRIGILPGEYNEDETMGALIGGLSPGGPAEKAGLLKGDWIVKIGDKPVKNMTSYMTAMAGRKKGEEIEFTVRRGEKEVKVKVVPE